MRNALHALTDELRRLKTAGVKTVAVSDESIAALRRVVAARAGQPGREVEKRRLEGWRRAAAGSGRHRRSSD